MEGETDLTSRHQVLEEGDKFESSFLRLEGCCFLALLRVDTLVGFAIQEENASYFKATDSPHDSVYQEQ